MLRKQVLLLAIVIVSYLLLGILSNQFGLINTVNKNTSSTKIQGTSSRENTSVVTVPPEITAIKTSNQLSEQVESYKKLIERVGPEKAQEELFRSGLPFDGQTHLLNHTVGDVLYEKYGVKGLSFCRDYFLSSCYHGFVIHAVAKGGFEALKNVMDNCWSKGEHVAVQCAHAIGHGFLAYDGYANLTKALLDCDELANSSEHFPLYNCHDGTFMENVWAVHETGKPSKDRWIKDDDPIYPCNDPRIDYKYLQACWSNQPMRLYQLYQGDLARVAQVCLSITNYLHQTTCFDGLARQIHPLTKGSIDETFRMCSLMPGPWIDPCIISNARATFSVGDRTLPFLICERIHEETKENCYSSLAGIIASYEHNNLSARSFLCNKIPNESWRTSCL